MRAPSQALTLSSTTFGKSPPNSPAHTPRAFALPLGLYDELRFAVRENDVHELSKLLNGRVFNEEDTQWLHALEFKAFAKNSPDAVQLLRTVKVGEAFEFVDKRPDRPDPIDPLPRISGPLSERQMEFLDTAFTREDKDAINELLDGTGVSREDAYRLLLNWRQRPT
ncbi:MAG TPA: hypothetical protein VLG41_07285 [Hydrogenophaga sp.]|uniref:hypothetical protein n=1 Tax=Hydrogenophaga sp. TaxID=1904254 RepID=UPI002BC9FB8D|nr:hypothetical protein [Hydrogenophaga sp.]HSX92706.1 hypothetical protein [Hydrogenophaga sp.]